MKSLPYLLITTALLLFTACGDSDSPISGSTTGSGTGYLSLAGLQPQAASGVTLSTRTVDSDLAIDIYTSDDTDTPLQHYDAGDAAASEKIEMNVGDYLLKAYTENYETEYGDGEYGAAKHYVEQAFTIEADKVNYLTVEVPMINFGVTFDLPDLSEWFQSYSFTVSYNGRTCKLTNIGDIAYFDLTDDDEAELYVIFSAVNNDGEQSEEYDHFVTSTHEDGEISLEAGKIYQVEYAIATKSLLVHE